MKQDLVDVSNCHAEPPPVGGGQEEGCVNIILVRSNIYFLSVHM